MSRLFRLLLLSVGCLSAQNHSGLVPRFEDYPAGAIFKGTPAALNLATSAERDYAEQISDEYTVFREGKEAQGPNFAGSLFVVRWGCGAPCVRMAIVDAQTGRVHYPPISINGVGAQSFDLPLLVHTYSVAQNPEVEFQADSNLMIIKASPNHLARHPSSYAYYFLWRQNQWTLLRRMPLRQSGAATAR